MSCVSQVEDATAAPGSEARSILTCPTCWQQQPPIRRGVLTLFIMDDKTNVFRFNTDTTTYQDLYQMAVQRFSYPLSHFYLTYQGRLLPHTADLIYPQIQEDSTIYLLIRGGRR